MKLMFPGKFGALAGGAFADFSRPAGVRTLCDLAAWLADARPALGEAIRAATTLIVVNHAVIRDPLHNLADDDEIAFLPPMSGG